MNQLVRVCGTRPERCLSPRGDTTIDTMSEHGSLRLFAWNCAGAFHRKANVVVKAAPDIVVLSEVAEPSLQECRGSTSCISIGTAQGRSLAIVSFNGWELEPADVCVPDRLFLPVIARRGDAAVSIVGVCVKACGGYVAPTRRALHALHDFVTAGSTIIAGDFNQTTVLDPKRGPSGRFEGIVDAMKDLGLRSAWHAHHGEEFGHESVPTYFHHWKQEKPWHIDYAFVSASIQIAAARLGNFEEIVATKLSDHVPLEVALHLPSSV